MDVREFIDKWRYVELKERSASQEHFIDICRVIGHPTPAEADPGGESNTTSPSSSMSSFTAEIIGTDKASPILSLP